MVSIGRFIKIVTLVFKMENPNLFPKLKFIPKSMNIVEKLVPINVGKLEPIDPTDDAIKYKVVYRNENNIFEVDEESGTLSIIKKPPSCTSKETKNQTNIIKT